MIIGITGKSGSGKSTYAKSLSGFYHISFDEIGHQVIEEYRDHFRKRFGTSDRKLIGDLIFNSRDRYKEVSDFCWKFMQEKIDKEMQSHENVVLDFILLPHSKYWSMCDKKILMKATDEERKKRVLNRDKISEYYFELRDSKSIEYNESEMDEIIETKEK